MDGLVSPGSDSGSLTTDENGMPVRRAHKGSKICPGGGGGKQPMVNWAELLPPPPEHPPPSEMGSPADSAMDSLQRCNQGPGGPDGQRFEDNNRSPISPVSKISACSCPVPHESVVHGLRGVPCYSDTEYTGGPPHGGGPRYPDLRPYSPKPLSMRTQSPMMPGGGGVRVGAGGPGMRACHMCPPPPYLGQGGLEGMCPHHHNYYSDIDPYGPRPGQGGGGGGGAYTVSGAPASLHGYRLPPLDGGMGGDPRMMVSDSEGHPRHLHVYPGVGEGPLMDRACQSSLPSLANECIHSPGYRSSR